MSAPNFKTMADFPLIAAETPYMRVCPECGFGNCGDDEKCENCGCDISNVEAVVDDFLCEEMMRDMQKVADKLNEVQDFYTVSVESGYYTGCQFYVADKYYDVSAMDNEEARDEFGMCRSEMLRRFKVAGNTIRRELRKAAKDLGIGEYLCTARFSNGEAWYTKVEPNKPVPLKVAVKAAIAAA